MHFEYKKFNEIFEKWNRNNFSNLLLRNFRTELKPILFTISLFFPKNNDDISIEKLLFYFPFVKEYSKNQRILGEILFIDFLKGIFCLFLLRKSYSLKAVSKIFRYLLLELIFNILSSNIPSCFNHLKLHCS